MMGSIRRRGGQAGLAVLLVACLIVLGPAQPEQLARPVASAELDISPPAAEVPVAPGGPIGRAESSGEPASEEEAEAEGYPAFTVYPKRGQMPETGGAVVGAGVDERGTEGPEMPAAAGVGSQHAALAPVDTSTATLELAAGTELDVTGSWASSPTDQHSSADARGGSSYGSDPGPPAGLRPEATAPSTPPDQPAPPAGDPTPPVAGGPIEGEPDKSSESVDDGRDEPTGLTGDDSDEPTQPDDPVTDEPDEPAADEADAPVVDEPDDPAADQPVALWPDADAVADAWVQRTVPPGPGQSGWDEGAALGLWWALLEHCLASAGAGPGGCGSSVDAWMTSIPIEVPDPRLWAEVDEDGRRVGYSLGLQAVGREDEQDLPCVLPDWVSELWRP